MFSMAQPPRLFTDYTMLPDMGGTTQTTREPTLTQQVYNFTKVNWAGFQPNNVPVTIKYPAQLAQKYASLEQLDGDWYSLITGGFLLEKAWFI
jgi:hypothetical protein